MNSFGIALDRRLADDAEVQDLAKALYEQLVARQDSDGDGYVDVLEVVAGTLPGNVASKPSAKPAALEALLKRRGGLEHYRPR